MSVQPGVMFQYFQWHSPADGTLWDVLAKDAPLLAERGVTAVWIPPAYKGKDGPKDEGYAVYDLYDLGEFDQKGSVRTKYGTKDQLLNCIKTLQKNNLRVYADVVLNHRLGADEMAEVEVMETTDGNRLHLVSDKPFKIKTWCKFNFPGRGTTHSDMKWTCEHFVAFNYAEGIDKKGAIYIVAGKKFSDEVDSEYGNFDYLMGADVDMYHPKVVEGLQHWGRWFVDTTNVDGFRLDAVKHIPASFYKDWLNHLRTHFGNRELICFGEYWSPDLKALEWYISKTTGVTKLFDVPLHYNFFNAGKQGEAYDLSKILDNTLVKTNPLMAVTFVDNHDTQPDCSLQSFVEPWFKPLAYALILLRQDGYPCVFHADYFGSEAEICKLPSHRILLDKMLDARRRYCYGDQHDYFDHPSCVAWVRTGNEEHPGSMVVVMSNGKEGIKKVNAYAPNGVFIDATGHLKQEIKTNDKGEGEFPCPAGNLSIWVQK